MKIKLIKIILIELLSFGYLFASSSHFVFGVANVNTAIEAHSTSYNVELGADNTTTNTTTNNTNTNNQELYIGYHIPIKGNIDEDLFGSKKIAIQIGIAITNNYLITTFDIYNEGVGNWKQYIGVSYGLARINKENVYEENGVGVRIGIGYQINKIQFGYKYQVFNATFKNNNDSIILKQNKYTSNGLFIAYRF
jgi:hypothetical protein